MTVKLSDLTKKDTGSILFFSGNGAFSKAIMAYQAKHRQKYWNISHVGILNHNGEDATILESTTLGNVPDIISGQSVKGVQMVDAAKRLKSYKGDYWISRIHKGALSDIAAQVSSLYDEYAAAPYEDNQLALAMSAWRNGLYDYIDRVDDMHSIFCSELVAMLWRGQYWPLLLHADLWSRSVEPHAYCPAEIANICANSPDGYSPLQRLEV